MGYKVFIINEIATRIINLGIKPFGEDAIKMIDFEDILLKLQLEESKKEYMFLMAEFDNFRKRTIKEKADIIRNATEKAMKDILPIVDDFERGLTAMAETSDAESVKEGMNLIYNKFVKYLEQNGVKAIESNGADFDTELHEAIAMIPAADDSQKGKVIDTVTKGYTMNDKVIRHSKVAVAQ